VAVLWRKLSLAFRHPPSRQPIAVILWGKDDCHLCEKAAAILDRLAGDFPLVVEKRDITRDPQAFARYRYVIPVVEIIGGPTFEGKITEHRLRRTLEGLRTVNSTRP
jgi:thiol-disulfide isomerase/thioredoxin